MKEFKGKVAVITGGASGIGRSLALRCAREGMKVVLADIQKDALDSTEKELKAAGASVLGVITDVSKPGDIEALAKKTLDTFGGVHLLFNNAGVQGGTNIWRSTLPDWQWVMGINLWGVIHGIHTFVPIMLKQPTDCYIVNTASTAGLVTGPSTTVYAVSKHAVVALSEVLFHQLAQRNANIGTSVLCPSLVNTKIVEAERNRPQELRNDPAEEQRRLASPLLKAQFEANRAMIQKAMSPDTVSDIVFDAIRANKFYILTDPDSIKIGVRRRMEDILQERNPTLGARSSE